LESDLKATSNDDIISNMWTTLTIYNMSILMYRYVMNMALFGNWLITNTAKTEEIFFHHPNPCMFIDPPSLSAIEQIMQTKLFRICPPTPSILILALILYLAK
jgi:hypothetical protein